MKKIEASTLEEAYTLAASELNCSVTELDVQIVQNPTAGVLGLFKKPAIIVAVCKGKAPKEEAPKPVYQKIETPKFEPVEEPKVEAKKESYTKSDFDKLFDDSFLAPDTTEVSAPAPSQNPDTCKEIEARLERLFKNTCYKIDTIKVSMYDDRTIKVFIDGEDAALLIGKDGYRYKALSYILFNWVNPEYGYLLRLEVAEFLQNQEEMIARYLEPVIDQIEESGRGQTRTLDGVLVQIALKELRGRFPGKYVAIKTTPDGKGKFVVVNDFIRRNDRNFL